MKLAFATVALLAFAAASVDVSAYDQMHMTFKFETWRREHNFDFQPFEYVERFRAFSNNDKIIDEHNAKESSYKLGHNQFSHLTKSEYSSMLGYSGEPRTPFRETNDFAEVKNLATSIDWTTKGAVTPVKNQGQCGSCWSFSTTGALEGAYFLKNGDLVSFSEQELVDCDHDGDKGCNGGLMDNAFEYIKENGGMCKEDDYSYIGSVGACKASQCDIVEGSAIQTFTDVKPSEKALMAALNQQPVAIAIEADQSSFQLYKSGVMTGRCGSQLDHGVLVVGYGSEDGTDFWKVKNSWGPSWGDEGFIKLERGKKVRGGQCGILMKASYPTL